MRARRWLSLLLLGVLLFTWSQAWVTRAQEAPPPQATTAVEEAPQDQDQSTVIKWDEAAFVLLVLFLVMAGMIGFEWVHRRRAML